MGLPANASQTEITRAYRRPARQFHPDRQPPERKVWAEEQMKRLNEAYATLGEPEARARYDAAAGLRFGARPPNATPARTPSSNWQRLKAQVNIVFWTLVTGFVVVGAYLLLVEWRYMFQNPMQVQVFPLQWAVAGVC